MDERAHGDSPADVWGIDRVYPDDSFMFQCHLFGYTDLASHLEPGARVLDLACGEGYGSAVLAARGARVVGLDLDAAFLSEAARKYRAASFVAGSALQLPFADASFDAIGALQMIEHLEQTDRLLSECARVLKPDGFAYFTTPNIDQLPDTASKEFNPHHVIDFTPSSLALALAPYFRDVEVFGQTLDETLPRTRALLEAAQKEWAVVGTVGDVERRVRNMPGPLRVRLRRFLLKRAGIPAWPLPEAERARREIRSEDFRATKPAEASGNTIAIARAPRTSSNDDARA
jgi:2-polyprenyl-3-methyl-5-hydroxy-6-metoxy-1,4-benzoquinol methylase